MEDKDIISQLWRCIQNGYSYDETKIHINAYMSGMTTARKVVVVKKEE